MNEMHSLALILVIAAVTLLLRFLPFFIFSGKRKVPGYIIYLGEKLPYAIMGMLIVYCLRNVDFAGLAHWLPSLIAVAVVVGFHLWKRNTLLSIIGGTAIYMFLLQTVFA